jgi:hypothetical protein
MANTDATMLEVKVDALPEVPSELIGIDGANQVDLFCSSKNPGYLPSFVVPLNLQ